MPDIITEDGEELFALETLVWDKKEYIAVSDVINWLKAVHSKADAVSVHWLIKTLVKMKNQKVK